MTASDLRDRIRALTGPVAERAGLDLVAVEWGVGGENTLRLSIDRAGGVSAQDCARFSRAVEPLLDAEDPIRGRYVLEVSSPGIERPVQRPSDFLRFQGFQARIRLEPGPPRRRYTGALAGLDGDDVLIVVDGETHRFHIDTIERAHLVLSLEDYEALSEGLPDIPNAPTEGEEVSDDHE